MEVCLLRQYQIIEVKKEHTIVHWLNHIARQVNIKHRTIQKFGLVDKEGVELLKAKYAYLIRQPKRKK